MSRESLDVRCIADGSWHQLDISHSRVIVNDARGCFRAYYRCNGSLVHQDMTLIDMHQNIRIAAQPMTPGLVAGIAVGAEILGRAQFPNGLTRWYDCKILRKSVSTIQNICFEVRWHFGQHQQLEKLVVTHHLFPNAETVKIPSSVDIYTSQKFQQWETDLKQFRPTSPRREGGKVSGRVAALSPTPAIAKRAPIRTDGILGQSGQFSEPCRLVNVHQFAREADKQVPSGESGRLGKNKNCFVQQTIPASNTDGSWSRQCILDPRISSKPCTGSSLAVPKSLTPKLGTTLPSRVIQPRPGKPIAKLSGKSMEVNRNKDQNKKANRSRKKEQMKKTNDAEDRMVEDVNPSFKDLNKFGILLLSLASQDPEFDADVWLSKQKGKLSCVHTKKLHE